MYLYKIATVEYEGHSPMELVHEKKFSRKQLVDMYISCFEEAYRRALAKFKMKVWDEELFDSFGDIGMLHCHIMPVFIEKYGFRKLEYETELGIWEYISADPKEDHWSEVKNSKTWSKIRQALIETTQNCKSRIRAEIEDCHAQGLDAKKC